MKYVDTWDLDSIFPGGTKSEELQAKLKALYKEVKSPKGLCQKRD